MSAVGSFDEEDVILNLSVDPPFDSYNLILNRVTTFSHGHVCHRLQLKSIVKDLLKNVSKLKRARLLFDLEAYDLTTKDDAFLSLGLSLPSLSKLELLNPVPGFRIVVSVNMTPSYNDFDTIDETADAQDDESPVFFQALDVAIEATEEKRKAE